METACGAIEPVKITPEMLEAGVENLGSRKQFLDAVADHYARELADTFKVSVQAMRIRLQELAILPPDLP